MGYFNLNKLLVEALAKKTTFRQPFTWYNYEDILNGTCEQWNNYVSAVPSASRALRDIINMRRRRADEIISKYHLTGDEIPEYLHTFIGLDPVKGMYYGSLGPYQIGSGEEKLFYMNFMVPNGIRNSTKEDILNGVALAKEKMNRWMIENNKGEPTPFNIAKTLDEISKSIRADIKSKKNTQLNDSIKDLIIGRSGDRVKFYYKVAIRVENDMANKFGFFSKKYQPSNKNTIIEAIKTFMANNLSEFLGVVSEEDLQLEINNGDEIQEGDSEDTELSPARSNITVLKNLSENSPTMASIPTAEELENARSLEDIISLKNRGMLINVNKQDGTKIALSQNGYKKILMHLLQNKFSPISKEVMTIMSTNNISDIDVLSDFVLNNDMSSFNTLNSIKSDKNLKGIKFKKIIEKVFHDISGELVRRNCNVESLLVSDENQDAVQEFNNILSQASSSAEIGNVELQNLFNREAEETDEKVLKKIYKEINKIQEKMIEDGDPRVALMMKVPKIGLAASSRRKGAIGQQVPDALSRLIKNPSYLNVPTQKLKIFNAIYNNKNLSDEQIAEVLNTENSSRTVKKTTRASGTYTSGTIANWKAYFDDMKNNNVLKAKYNTTDPLTDDQLKNYLENNLQERTMISQDEEYLGYDTMGEAQENADEFLISGGSEGDEEVKPGVYGGKDIDPVTGACITPPAKVLPLSSRFKNITAKELAQKRDSREGAQPRESAFSEKTLRKINVEKTTVENTEPETTELEVTEPAVIEPAVIEPEVTDQAETEETIEFDEDFDPSVSQMDTNKVINNTEDEDRDYYEEIPTPTDYLRAPDEDQEDQEDNAENFSINEINNKEKEEEEELLDEDFSRTSNNSSKRKIISNVMYNLINIAKEIDLEGKSEESEEIHKIIRKYLK